MLTSGAGVVYDAVTLRHVRNLEPMEERGKPRSCASERQRIEDGVPLRTREFT